MQWKLEESVCGGSQLLILQEQGDNSPTIITFDYDVTDFVFRGTINFATPIEVTNGDGIEIVSASESLSTISLQLTSLETQDIPEGQYAFDLWMTDTDAVNSLILTGFYVISEALTRIAE